VDVDVRQDGDLGLGAFAVCDLAAGAFVTEYVGELIDFKELKRRYPSLEPEYCFRVNGEGEEEQYVDAVDSEHWSRRMNHDAMDPTVDFEIEDLKVVFYAARKISAGEALRFDYGEEFWDGRSTSPGASTDGRIFSPAVAVDDAVAALGVPVSLDALEDLLKARAPKQQKKAAMMRALEYFGADRDAVEMPGGGVVSYDDATHVELGDALRAIIVRLDDEDDDDDDDDGPKKSKAAPAKEKVKDMALYDSLGVAPDAAEGAIKKAYYKAALSCHPDKHPGDLKAKEAFQKISTAYAVLSDPVARQRYDSKGSVDPAKAGPGTSQFYAMVFGSDAFVRYVGELRIASMFQKAAAGDDGDDDDEPDTAEAEFRQAKRAVTLATTLRDDLEPFLKGEMDAAALAQRSRAVADALASTSLGATLVRVIAHVYKASAARHSPGAGAAVQKARDFTHLMGTRLEALVAGAASVGAAHRMRRAVGSEAAAAAADDGVPLSKAVCLVVTDAGGDWACRAFARKPDAEAHFKQLPYTRAAVLFSRAPAAGRRAAGEWKAERRYGIGYATRALVDAVAAAPGDATTRGLNTRRLKAIQGEMVGSVFAVGWRMSVVDVEATLGSAISKLFRDAGRDASKRQRLGEGLAVVGDAFLKAADASKHEASVLEQLLAHEFGKMEQQGAKKGAKGRPR